MNSVLVIRDGRHRRKAALTPNDQEKEEICNLARSGLPVREIREEMSKRHKFDVG